MGRRQELFAVRSHWKLGSFPGFHQFCFVPMNECHPFLGDRCCHSPVISWSHHVLRCPRCLFLSYLCVPQVLVCGSCVLVDWNLCICLLWLGEPLPPFMHLFTEDKESSVKHKLGSCWTPWVVNQWSFICWLFFNTLAKCLRRRSLYLLKRITTGCNLRQAWGRARRRYCVYCRVILCILENSKGFPWV